MCIHAACRYIYIHMHTACIYIYIQYVNMYYIQSLYTECKYTYIYHKALISMAVWCKALLLRLMTVHHEGLLHVVCRTLRELLPGEQAKWGGLQLVGVFQDVR